ncbi:response regulator [Desulfocurvus vexinensis]|uniref:response regulator n=1 Tax=Desulfocurvus vexinensis TaxID=399548 RepID=UPI0004B47F11|nr:response regulator [Desulfocurvus vexinensis]
MTPPDGGANRILVVDDEAIIITQLEDMLAALGYEVVGKTSSGADAVRLVRELAPDLVLMDIVMPGAMDGITACATIQEQLDTPVILLTAYGDDSHIAQAKAVRPYGYILKPSQNDQIKAAIEIALEKKAVERDMAGVMAGLRSQAVDRELQLKEIHHRIKSNLNMICGLLALQGMRCESGACADALRAVRGRVLSVAKVHEALSSSRHLDSINARDYFRSLADAVRRAYAVPDALILDLDCPDLELEPDKAMPMGLICTELLTNALRHAFPGGRAGRVRIVLGRAPGVYELAVSDDGVGLPPGLDVRNSGTLGLELVHGLAAQVGGGVELAPGPGAGFLVRIPA